MPLKFYAYAAVALALLAGLWYVKHLHAKASERDAYKAKAEAVQASLAKYQEDVSKAQEADSARRAALELTLSTVSAQLEKLKSEPRKPEVNYRAKPGEPCPAPSISDSWFRVRYEAYDAVNRSLHPAD